MLVDSLNALALITNFIIVPGIAYGSQLALGALGVTLIYSILRFSNFAHGELMSFGAMFTILVTFWFKNLNLSISPLPTALLALPFGIIISISLCLIIDRLVFKYYRKVKSENVTYLIVSIGVMFTIGGLIRFIIGPKDRVFTDGSRFILKAREFKSFTGLSEGISIKMTQGVTFFTAVLVVAFVFWFLNKTKTGKSMRAYSDNEDLALLSGISPERVIFITWLLVGSLAAIAGTLYGLDKSYKPFTYLQILLPIFASAIVGGIGSPLGAIAGGFVIAFSELFITFAYKKFFTYMFRLDNPPDGLLQILSTDYKIAVSFVILLIVLLIRPSGIFVGKTL